MDNSRRKSRLFQVKQEELIKYFVAGSTVRSAAVLAGVNRNTATLYLNKLREEIASRPEQKTLELMCDAIELDESYFGGVRKGKRGRGAGRKILVFGLLNRNGKVHAFPIPNARTETLLAIIRQSISQIQLFIQTAFLPIMFLMYLSFTRSGSTIQKPLWMSTIISMELGTSGTKLSAIYVDLMAFLESIFIYF